MNRWPWRVTETRYDLLCRAIAVLYHMQIGTTPMSERDARAYADAETARYCNTAERRSFHAEPAYGGPL